MADIKKAQHIMVFNADGFAFLEKSTKVRTFLLEDERQWFGFNTPEQYEEAQRRMKSRLEDLRT